MRDAYVAIRTRFFDDALLSASDDGIRQVVIPGAGLDARAFRMPWNDRTRVFELDISDVFEFKERVLAEQSATPRCQRIVVPVDLRDDWPTALRSSGFRADQPSVWLLEGVLMYLTQAESDRLIATISGLADSGSRMAVEPPTWRIPAEVASAVARGTLDRATMAMAAQLSQAAAEDASVTDPVGWLSGWGWRVQLYDVAERFAAYSRATSPGVAAMLGAGPRRWLATAERVRV
jgi:methyltransferase (TIGR00027 family)